MKSPYYLVCNIKKNSKGKEQKYFIYTLNKESGLPDEILKQHKSKAVPVNALPKRTKSAAESWILQLISELKTGQRVTSGGATFGEYTKDLMLRGKCPHERFVNSGGRELSISYMKDRRGIYKNHIAIDDKLMALILSETKRKDLLAYRERLVDRLGNTATAKKAFQLVKTIYKEIFYMEKISYDPTFGLGDLRYKAKIKGILSIEELKVIFPQDSLGPWKNQYDYTAFFLTYCAGLRKGEVLALKWGNIDFKNKILNVVEAWKEIEHKVGLPKKDKLRWTPLPEIAIKKLQELKTLSNYSNDNDFVFCYQKKNRWEKEPGQNFSGTWWRKRFIEAMDIAKVERESRNIQPHSLRHSLNTHLQDQGYSKEKIRHTLGWTSEDVQLIYTHA